MPRKVRRKGSGRVLTLFRATSHDLTHSDRRVGEVELGFQMSGMGGGHSASTVVQALALLQVKVTAKEKRDNKSAPWKVKMPLT